MSSNHSTQGHTSFLLLGFSPSLTPVKGWVTALCQALPLHTSPLFPVQFSLGHCFFSQLPTRKAKIDSKWVITLNIFRVWLEVGGHTLVQAFYFISPAFLLVLSFYYSCSNFPPFALLCPAHSLLPQSVPTPMSMSMVIHTCFLTDSFPFFLLLSPPPSLLAAVNLFHVSTSLALFCVLVYSVH